MSDSLWSDYADEVKVPEIPVKRTSEPRVYFLIRSSATWHRAIPKCTLESLVLVGECGVSAHTTRTSKILRDSPGGLGVCSGCSLT